MTIMPISATLNNATSVLAFTVPAGALGYVVANESASTIRIRHRHAASNSGANKGIPIAAGGQRAQYFAAPLKAAMTVHAIVDTGADATLTWDTLNE